MSYLQRLVLGHGRLQLRFEGLYLLSQFDVRQLGVPEFLGGLGTVLGQKKALRGRDMTNNFQLLNEEVGGTHLVLSLSSL